MKRWPVRTLGEFVEERTDRVGRSVATVYSVTNDAGFVPSLDRFNKRVFSAEISSYKRVARHDLAYNPSRINVGSVAMFEDLAGGAVSPMYSIVRCKDGLLPQYLLRFLRSQEGLLQIQRLCEGSVRFQLKFRDLCRIPLRFPPVHEQERIVGLIDEAFALQRVRAEADKRTEALAPSFFDEMFGDPEHARFAVKELVALVLPERPITYGILKPGPDTLDGIPYVRVLDIKQGLLHVDQLRKTTKNIADQYRRSELCPGDVLITIRGTVGRTCVVPDELRGANITQDTARLAFTPAVDTTYMVEFLNTPWAQRWMSRRMLGQAVKGLNLGDLRKLPVQIPPLPLQRDLAARVTEIRDLRTDQAMSRNRLDDLFQSVLHGAFAGGL